MEEKEQKFGTEVEVIIKLQTTKKSLMNDEPPGVLMIPSVFLLV